MTLWDLRISLFHYQCTYIWNSRHDSNSLRRRTQSHQSRILHTEQHVTSLANNTHQKLMSTVHPLTVIFGLHPEKMHVASNYLNYGVILGKKWTSKHHAIPNCYKNEIKFEHKGNTHSIVAREPSNDSLVPVNAITKDYDQKYAIKAVVLRNIPENNQEMYEKNRAQDVQRRLQEYKDVFPKQKSACDITITLKEGRIPQRKGIIPNVLHRAQWVENAIIGSHWSRIHTTQFKSMRSTCSIG